jgi:hypothetical protein
LVAAAADEGLLSVMNATLPQATVRHLLVIGIGGVAVFCALCVAALVS